MPALLARGIVTQYSSVTPEHFLSCQCFRLKGLFTSLKLLINWAEEWWKKQCNKHVTWKCVKIYYKVTLPSSQYHSCAIAWNLSMLPTDCWVVTKIFTRKPGPHFVFQEFLVREAGNFSLSPPRPDRSGPHAASYTMGNMGSFLGGKASGAWIWPLTSI
jgi:hypothetical protein